AGGADGERARHQDLGAARGERRVAVDDHVAQVLRRVEGRRSAGVDGEVEAGRRVGRVGGEGERAGVDVDRVAARVAVEGQRLRDRPGKVERVLPGGAGDDDRGEASQ